MKTPKKVGGPVELCPRVFGKTAVNQRFVSPTGEKYDYLLWDYKNGLFITPIVLPLTDNFDVVAEKQYRHGANTIIWEIPGGCQEPGEKSVEVVNKELLEETGFEAAKLQLLGKKPFWWEPANLNVSYWLYLATGCKKIRELQLEKTEYIEVVLVPWKKWLKMTKDGTVLDSKTIVATHLAEDYIKSLSK